MSTSNALRLRYNFGFLLESAYGTSSQTELSYPSIRVASDLALAPLQGSFTATHISEGIYINGQLESMFPVECVRCLADMSIRLVIELDELFYFPPWSAPAGEYSVGEDGNLDLAPLIREQSLLAVPSQPLCKPNCAGLCIECGFNLNEGDCGCEDDAIDPRLAALKTLLD